MLRIEDELKTNENINILKIDLTIEDCLLKKPKKNQKIKEVLNPIVTSLTTVYPCYFRWAM